MTEHCLSPLTLRTYHVTDDAPMHPAFYETYLKLNEGILIQQKVLTAWAYGLFFWHFDIYKCANKWYRGEQWTIRSAARWITIEDSDGNARIIISRVRWRYLWKELQVKVFISIYVHRPTKLSENTSKKLSAAVKRNTTTKHLLS